MTDAQVPDRRTPGFAYADFQTMVGQEVGEHVYDELVRKREFQFLCEARDKAEQRATRHSEPDVVRALDDAVDAYTDAITAFATAFVAQHTEATAASMAETEGGEDGA